MAQLLRTGATRPRAHADPPTLPRGDRASRREAASIVLLGLAILFLLVSPLMRATYPLEMPNEGWNATHALNAFTANLYPDADGFIVNNYAPLWFYLSGALVAWIGDPIFPGRALALTGFFGTGAALYFLVRRLGGSRSAGVAGAGSFFVVTAGLFHPWVGLFEPQFLAHALVTAGAAVVVGARSNRAAASAAILMVLGGLCKQVVIGLPLASAVWLLLYRRELARAWFATGIAVALVALLGLVLGYGSAFLHNIGVPRILTASRLGTNLAPISRAVVPLAALAIVLQTRNWRPDAALAYAALAVGGGLVSILAFGAAAGVSSNIAFDLVIGASIGFGLAWHRFGALFGERRGDLLRIVLVLALLARVGIGLAPIRLAPSAERQQFDTEASVLADLRQRLTGIGGPVACETLSVCAWAGLSNSVDLWKLRHERTLSSLDQTRLLRQLSETRFAAVTLFGRFAGAGDDGNLPGLAAALEEGYGAPIYFGQSVTLFLPKPPE